QQCFGVPAKQRQHGYLHAFPAAEGIAKYGRLTEREPYVEADEHECGACQKRNSPTEAEETFVGQRVGERQKCASGQEEPQWCAELRKHSVPSALPGRRVFDRQQDRASPFTT